MLTDFHSHILPGMDDGSSCPGESVGMLQMLAQQGIRHVIATPHFYPAREDPASFLRRRTQAEACLQEEMAKYSDLPVVSMGAEVAYVRQMSQWEHLPQLTAPGGKCVLVELPFGDWPETVLQELEQIWKQWDIVPVVAHIDRYLQPMRRHRILRQLAEIPVLVQANSSFFHNPMTASAAMRMLRQDRIHFVGSDCHDLVRRKPNMDLAISSIGKKLGQDALARLCEYERQYLPVE